MGVTLDERHEPGPAAPPARPGRPRWERPALGALLAGTAVLYLWNLGATGYGNSFYAAAVQAGTRSGTALFFGSLDPENLITVDKPPASLWVMELSTRLFGFSSWAMLVPQALMAVAAVALLWATVRRVAGPGAGLLAGALLALTPVAALMFKYDNPDALLVLLLVVAGYCTVRALVRASTRWILLAGLAIGFAFLAKELQAFLVVPGPALAYLWAAPTALRRRIAQLLGAGAAIVVGAGWWVLAVALWPAADRPYIGGSTNDSELGRAFGYNGLGRIFGQGLFGGRGAGAAAAADAADAAGGPGGRGGVGDFGGFGGMGGQAGILRMFESQVGGQVSWLLPAALILLVAGLWFTRRSPRTDLTRAALLLWGGWTVVGAVVLSLMQGTFHPYYTLVLVPGIVGLVVVGGRQAWLAQATLLGRLVLTGTTVVTAVWSFVLLDRTPQFLPWLRWTVLLLGVVLGLLLWIVLAVPSALRGRLGVAVLAAAVVVGVAGPAAYAVETALTPHRGGGVTAGPAVATGGAAFRAAGGAAAAAGRARLAAGGGGFGDAVPNGQVATLLETAGTRWSAATVGSSAAASLELASGTAVMALGGFTGSDRAPTLAEFQTDVQAGLVHYLVLPEGGGTRGGGVGAAITQWVQQHYAADTVGGQTVYDLAAR
ncbi:ArnT family glycosyltransferase [Pseudonocardia oroxyli]|uniref:4-amino-4-deoxy-L-arabinose transferase n=1 Tax=Pseudonocardia oroxyli TaxID=366584 RepID=A0A1G7WMM8_PSEOR|nr:glycosyltransferase family 39 protein [Pseudonocardia oroxyli]SDG73139.1 4-amino-4-deoxy-L-arabinose transferase [Pseudonocardia oroxyli]